MTKNNPEKIRFFLYAVIFLVLLAVVAAFVNYRYFSSTDEQMVENEKKPTLSMDKVKHIATKDGAKQWSLDASVVNYYGNDNKAVFQNIRLVYFTQTAEKAVLTAKNGELDTQTNDIVASGNVEVVGDSYRLLSDELHYNNKERTFISRVPVTIIEGESILTGDTMTSDLNSGKTLIEGNVKAVLRGNF